MSRIHEALVKAQQEGRSGSADAGSILQESWNPAAAEAGPSAPAPLVQANGNGAAAVVAAPAPAQPSPLDSVPRAKWSPQNSKLACHLSDREMRMVGVEQYRGLRSKLFALREKKPLKKVLITSSVPNEGKTFTSANLAQVTAQAYNTKVLLIGGDLRNPGLHEVLGAGNQKGLANYLRGECTEMEIMQRGEPENLFFIPSGPACNDAAELLTNGGLGVLLDKLAPYFDWVFIDSPPLLPLTDALMISKYCDGTLMVIRSGMVSAAEAKKALGELRGRPIVGVVLNGIDQHQDDYYYYSHYMKSGAKA